MTAPQQDEEEWQGAWYAAMATCDVCEYRWAAVYPECCDTIECSGCGHMTRAPHLVEALPPDEREPWQGTDDAGQDR